jgi:hypothetical protein
VQQLVQPLGGMSGDAREDVGQPGLWIDAIHLGRVDETIHGGGALSAAVRPAEQPDADKSAYDLHIQRRFELGKLFEVDSL